MSESASTETTIQGVGADDPGERLHVLQRAAASVPATQWSTSDLLDFLAAYYEHVGEDDLLIRDPVDLAAAVLSHRALAATRTPGEALVRVFTPTVDSHGWDTRCTIVEIVVDDMPFLVDSVRNALVGAGFGLHLLVHPIVAVQRDEQGHLVRVLGSAVTPEGDAGLDESWMHVQIDLQTRPEELERIRDVVVGVLADVRAAVTDWPQMRDQASRLAAGLPVEVPDDLQEQALAAQRLLEWLVGEHFTFLGYREYELTDDDELRVVPGTGLGILREIEGEDTPPDHLVAKVRQKARERDVLVLTKANSRSTVHRSTYLDYVGIKRFDESGAVVGERRFLGLFTSAAYTESIRRVPVLADKVDEIVRRARLAPDSHSGRDLLAILENYPRDELFQTSAEDLTPTVLAVHQMQERRRTRVLLRTDDYGRFVSVIVYLPRDRYNTVVRLRIEEILKQALGAESIEFFTRVGESVLARLYFVLRPAKGHDLRQVSESDLERRVVEATHSWEEDLADALSHQAGDAEGARLLRDWGTGFPDSYRGDVAARAAVGDLARLEAAIDDEATGRGATVLRSSLYEPVGAAPDERRFKLYRTEPLSLTTVLPFFRNLGLEVVDERPYTIRRSDGATAYIYDFGLRHPGLSSSASSREDLTEAFEAAWSGRAESDGFDQLVIAAGMTWRQVVVLRAYARYLRQAGSPYSQDYIESCLLTHVPIARDLVRLFEVRFDPDLPDPDGADDDRAQGDRGVDDRGVDDRGDDDRSLDDRAGGERGFKARQTASAQIAGQILRALDDVSVLDFDRILRSLLGAVEATVRTSFFQADPDDPDGGYPKSYVAMKLDPQRLPDLPSPRPAHEIWVYSPRVEGVHLRFGAVARGGLRWSDRREDFRTEVLGLVKAQMVKNAVIVPTGAKGGFFAKQLPDPADREAWLAEGVGAYKCFIRALLDVTDDLEPDPSAEGGRRVAPPQRVVRHDGDDPYLVVAADKGTATFSDFANGVSAEYGFWLDDAFASGGSAGYDHKAMGITARGAWESVKRHFREMGHDTQTQPFTVVGVGDMSGDVFGNGMLLSEQIKLVAAFDHRHIFLDPDPDPAVSFAERRRMFELPRSSWADYDASLISEGGGIHPRTAKSVTITPQVAGVLGLEEGATMTPSELMRAVLCAPVDLLWNGGIGTYVKSSAEANSDVGDKGNDAIRINGCDLRVKVVGEGGNLGLTQLGRIEAALAGVRINTDAIDNSAGVDCSDHEVNIKILLGQVVGAGDLTIKQRNELLAAMTDDVGRLVLRDNYEQNVLLGNARRQSAGMLVVHQRLIHSMEADGFLNRELEFLPSDAQIDGRCQQDQGLTSPEFAVLVAYAKIRLKQQILDSTIPDEPFFQRRLRDYFPPVLVEKYGDVMADHQLRRQIIATSVANDLVNRGGITFAYRAVEETGAAADQVVRAFTVAREVFGLDDYVAQVEALDNVVGCDLQADLYLEFRRLIDRAARWVLQNRPGQIDVQEEIDMFAPVAQRWRGRMTELVSGADLARVERAVEEQVSQGVPAELAARSCALLDEFSLLDVAELADHLGQPLERIADVHFAISDVFGLDWMLTRISRLPRMNRWEALARGAMRDDLYGAWMGLTRAVLDAGRDNDEASATERIQAWVDTNESQIARARLTLDEVAAMGAPDLSSMSVALRVLRSVIRSGSTSGH